MAKETELPLSHFKQAQPQYVVDSGAGECDRYLRFCAFYGEVGL